MKLYTFVDTHGNLKIIDYIIKKAKREDVDFLICAGDISNWSNNLKEVLIKFKEFPLILIPGNHEDENELAHISKKFENIIYLHKGSYEINDYVFFGYGGGGFSKENKEFKEISNKFLKDIKNKKIILITHQPPHNTSLDYLPHTGNQGCKDIRKFIEKAQPILHISGHLHENEGTKDKIGKTIIINPGPYGRIIEI